MSIRSVNTVLHGLYRLCLGPHGPTVSYSITKNAGEAIVVFATFLSVQKLVAGRQIHEHEYREIRDALVTHGQLQDYEMYFHQPPGSTNGEQVTVLVIATTQTAMGAGQIEAGLTLQATTFSDYTFQIELSRHDLAACGNDPVVARNLYTGIYAFTDAVFLDHSLFKAYVLTFSRLSLDHRDNRYFTNDDLPNFNQHLFEHRRQEILDELAPAAAAIAPAAAPSTKSPSALLNAARKKQ